MQRIITLLTIHRPLGGSRPLPRDTGNAEHPAGARTTNTDDWSTPWLT
ncbi:hypothetical protein [Streptomyces sp. NPDC091259]